MGTLDEHVNPLELGVLHFQVSAQEDIGRCFKMGDDHDGYKFQSIRFEHSLTIKHNVFFHAFMDHSTYKKIKIGPYKNSGETIQISLISRMCPILNLTLF